MYLIDQLYFLNNSFMESYSNLLINFRIYAHVYPLDIQYLNKKNNLNQIFYGMAHIMDMNWSVIHKLNAQIDWPKPRHSTAGHLLFFLAVLTPVAVVFCSNLLGEFCRIPCFLCLNRHQI